MDRTFPVVSLPLHSTHNVPPLSRLSCTYRFPVMCFPCRVNRKQSFRSAITSCLEFLVLELVLDLEAKEIRCRDSGEVARNGY